MATYGRKIDDAEIAPKPTIKPSSEHRRGIDPDYTCPRCKRRWILRDDYDEGVCPHCLGKDFQAPFVCPICEKDTQVGYDYPYWACPTCRAKHTRHSSW